MTLQLGRFQDINDHCPGYPCQKAQPETQPRSRIAGDPDKLDEREQRSARKTARSYQFYLAIERPHPVFQEAADDTAQESQKGDQSQVMHPVDRAKKSQ